MSCPRDRVFNPCKYDGCDAMSVCFSNGEILGCDPINTCGPGCECKGVFFREDDGACADSIEDCLGK